MPIEALEAVEAAKAVEGVEAVDSIELEAAQAVEAIEAVEASAAIEAFDANCCEGVVRLRDRSDFAIDVIVAIARSADLRKQCGPYDRSIRCGLSFDETEAIGRPLRLRQSLRLVPLVLSMP